MNIRKAVIYQEISNTYIPNKKILLSHIHEADVHEEIGDIDKIIFTDAYVSNTKNLTSPDFIDKEVKVSLSEGRPIDCILRKANVVSTGKCDIEFEVIN